MSKLRVRRLTAEDRSAGRSLFVLMANVFGEDCDQLGDAYLGELLGSPTFWAVAAFVGNEIVGGVTAHTLPMTRGESSELFIYDIAVRSDHQRTGVGRHLISVLRKQAAELGIEVAFVPADDEDVHALDFYRALGGKPSPVTLFTFSAVPGVRTSS